MFIFRRLFATAAAPTAAKMSTVSTKVQALIDENAVVTFTKSWCPYCRQTKSTLSRLGVDFKDYELDVEEDGDAVQQALLDISGQRTVPNIFIGRNHIGGNSDFQALAKSGKLQGLLKEAGAEKA